MSNPRGVLVTGAAGRIGSAIVSSFLDAGDHVIASDLDLEQINARLQRTDAAEGQLSTIRADVADERDVERLAREAIDAAGKIEVLVNCAGTFPNRPVVDMPTDEWDRVFNVNVRGPFMLSREIARHMLAQNIQGSIVNISSGAGSSARTGGSHYCGSKAALEMFTKVLAIELGPDGIRVNAVAPGLVLDEVLAPPVPEGTNPYVETLLAGIPLRRTGMAQEIADAVVFLCSDQATWITGTVLGVNGGSQAGRTHLPPSTPRT